MAALSGYYWSTVTCTSTASTTDVVLHGVFTGAATAIPVSYRRYPYQMMSLPDVDGLIQDKIPAGQRTLEMPDKSKLIIDDAGNYRIEDKDAVVTYRANRLREFSPYLNASDMIGKFVEYVQSIGGVKQSEVLGLPLELFINWLIIEAARRDADPVPEDVVPVKDHKALANTLRPQCLACGKFIPRDHYRRRFQFCSAEHGIEYARRALPALPDRAAEAA